MFVVAVLPMLVLCSLLLNCDLRSGVFDVAVVVCDCCCGCCTCVSVVVVPVVSVSWLLVLLLFVVVCTRVVLRVCDWCC